MIETFETSKKDILGTKDNGLRYRLSSYSYTNDDSQELGLDITRIHPSQPRTAPFLYSFSLGFSEDIGDMPSQRIQTLRRSFDRKAKKIPKLKEETDRFTLKTPDGNGLLVYWHYSQPSSQQSNITRTEINLYQDFDKKIETLDGVIASLPYAVRVFNQLSPLQFEREAVERAIRIARESDLIKHKSLRTK